MKAPRINGRNKGQLAADTVARLLSYTPETGVLTWKARPVEMFERTAKRSPEHSAKLWNSRWGGKEAFTAVALSGHKVGAIHGTVYLAHRIAWLLASGEWPEVIDHINGDPADNRLVNLRNVTQSENAKNAARRSDNTSGVAGVSWSIRDKKWTARVVDGGRPISLGSFSTKEEAISARLDAQEKFGFSPRHGRAQA